MEKLLLPYFQFVINVLYYYVSSILFQSERYIKQIMYLRLSLARITSPKTAFPKVDCHFNRCLSLPHNTGNKGNYLYMYPWEVRGLYLHRKESWMHVEDVHSVVVNIISKCHFLLIFAAVTKITLLSRNLKRNTSSMFCLLEFLVTYEEEISVRW